MFKGHHDELLAFMGLGLRVFDLNKGLEGCVRAEMFGLTGT